MQYHNFLQGGGKGGEEGEEFKVSKYFGGGCTHRGEEGRENASEEFHHRQSKLVARRL